MTHTEHAAEAERLLAEATEKSKGFARKGFGIQEQGQLAAAAVHAQLAVYKRLEER